MHPTGQNTLKILLYGCKENVVYLDVEIYD